MSDDINAASSAATETPEPALEATTAVEQAVVTGDVVAYREAKRAERATGKPLAAVAGSAPAQPEDQAASTDATPSPASEPGKASGHKGNAESRKAELDAEIQALLKQRAELRRDLAPLDAKPAVPSPARAKESDDPEPQLSDFESDPAKYPDPYTALIRAQARWEARQELKAERTQREQAEAAVKAAEAQKTRAEGFRASIAKAVESDPGFLDAVSDEVKALKPFDALAPGEAMTGLNAIAEELLVSPVAPLLMRHFSERPADLHRIAALSPRELLREMAKLETRFESGSAPAKTAPKVVTNAPTPPTLVVGRGTDSVSDVDAAVKADDVRAYRDAKMRERVARIR